MAAIGSGTRVPLRICRKNKRDLGFGGFFLRVDDRLIGAENMLLHWKVVIERRKWRIRRLARPIREIAVET